MYIVTNQTKDYISQKFTTYDEAMEHANLMAEKYLGFHYYVSRILGSSLAEAKAVYSQRLNEI